jgi:hypothetical protein
MKKLLTIVLVSAVVMALAAPAMAMHFEMNGQFRARSWYLNNYWPQTGSGLQEGDFEFVDQRFRMTTTWGLTENVQLKARADILEGNWGDTIGSIIDTGEVDPATGTPVTAVANNIQSKAAIAFDHVYATFQWPGAPLSVTAGRQPVAWGTGMAAAADNRDRLKLVIKPGALSLVIAYDKTVDSFTQELVGSGSDARNYVVGAVTNVSGWKTGALYVLIRDERNSGTIGVPNDNITHLFDVFATGQAGPVSLKADVAYVTGESGVAGGTKTDREGLGAYVGAFFNAGMANVGLEFAYAQGNDPSTADNEGGFSHDYHGPFNSVILWNGMDYQGYLNLSRGQGGDVGVSNALALKGSVTAKPTEKLTLIGAVVWGQVDEVAAGMDDALGVEVDAIGVYNIYDNVSWTLGVGYLSAGDYFGDVDDPWGVMNKLEVKF